MQKIQYLLVLLILSSNISVAQTIDVVTGLNGEPNRVFVVGNDLYFTEQVTNTLSKIDLTSSSPTAVEIIGGFNDPSSMAINGNDLYIAIGLDNKIAKIDITS